MTRAAKWSHPPNAKLHRRKHTDTHKHLAAPALPAVYDTKKNLNKQSADMIIYSTGEYPFSTSVSPSLAS